jgi:hypothetical protein
MGKNEFKIDSSEPARVGFGENKERKKVAKPGMIGGVCL